MPTPAPKRLRSARYNSHSRGRIRYSVWPWRPEPRHRPPDSGSAHSYRVRSSSGLEALADRSVHRLDRYGFPAFAAQKAVQLADVISGGLNDHLAVVGNPKPHFIPELQLQALANLPRNRDLPLGTQPGFRHWFLFLPLCKVIPYIV